MFLCFAINALRGYKEYMRLLQAFVCIIALGLSASAEADDKMRIVVLGDSLTSGFNLQPKDAFPAKLQQKLEALGYKNVEAINMGLDGETTGGGVDRINAVLEKKPDVVVVALGNNDMRRGISPAVINRNLGTMIGTLTRENIYVVLAGMKASPNVELSYAQQIDAIYPSLAAHYKVPLYPFLLEGVYEKPEYNLADGYNPNTQGVDIMVENLYRLVDAGLRWRWEVRQQQLEQEQLRQQTPQPPSP